jgi:hypothetical protein
MIMKVLLGRGREEDFTFYLSKNIMKVEGWENDPLAV